MLKPETVDGGAAVPVNDPVNEQDKVYGDAFAEAEGAGGAAELSPADDPANLKPEETPPAAPPEASPPEAPPETPPEQQQPGETDAEYKQRWLTLQGIHRHDKEAWELEKQGLLSQIEDSKKPPEPPPAETPPQTAQEAADAAAALYDSLTEDQKEALKNYEQDFDVVSKMEGIKREMELKKLRDEIDSKLAALDARINPVLKVAEDRENEAHFEAIESAHPDYENFVKDGSITAWIEKKPAYLRQALKHAYENGTAEDAISLLDDFKRENNISETPPASPENVVPINQKREQKRKALAGVDTRRSAVAVQTPIKDDYEGAFEEAAAKQV